MAGNARYTALVDACVFYSAAMTDSLLSLATAKLFAAKWTTKIESEWMAALEEQRPELKGKLDKRRDLMRIAVPDWEVPETAWGPITGGLVLPDKDDAHILASAIAGHADCIVTSNLRDFPPYVVEPHGIEIIHPDVFIVNQLDLSQIASLAAFKRMRARLKNPSMTPEEFTKSLARGGLPLTAERLSEAAELI